MFGVLADARVSDLIFGAFWSVLFRLVPGVRSFLD